MKSLNSTDKLWTSRSLKDVDLSDYQAACCLNGRVNSPAQTADPVILIENEQVSVDFLRKVLERVDHAKTQSRHSEDIKHPSP